jgi:hypothetical protein
VNRTDRTVHLLGLAIAPARRARFIEEWQADLAAARSVGLSPLEIIAAATRVAGFLLWTRVRAQVARRRTRGGLIACGLLLGSACVVTDVPLDALIPFVLLAIGWRAWSALRAWIDGGR